MYIFTHIVLNYEIMVHIGVNYVFCCAITIRSMEVEKCRKKNKTFIIHENYFDENDLPTLAVAVLTRGFLAVFGGSALSASFNFVNSKKTLS